MKMAFANTKLYCEVRSLGNWRKWVSEIEFQGPTGIASRRKTNSLKAGKWSDGQTNRSNYSIQHLGLLSLHCLKREVCAARFPASRHSFLSTTHYKPNLRLDMAADYRAWRKQAVHPHAGSETLSGATFPNLHAPTRVTDDRYTTQLPVVQKCFRQKGTCEILRARNIWV